jgi:hypothetical protein
MAGWLYCASSCDGYHDLRVGGGHRSYDGRYVVRLTSSDNDTDWDAVRIGARIRRSLVGA